MVLYCAADLIWASKIKATADALGIPCRPARTVAMLEARLADSSVAGLLVDTEAGPVALELIARLRSSAPAGAGIVAFGPHVEVGALAAARAAGADRVMTRGALHNGLEGVLRALAGPSSPPGLPAQGD